MKEKPNLIKIDDYNYVGIDYPNRTDYGCKAWYRKLNDGSINVEKMEYFK